MTAGNALSKLLSALQDGDFAALEHLFAAQAEFRASLPDEIVEAGTAAGVAACYRDWFGAAAEVQVLASSYDRLGDVTAFHYRLRARGSAGWRVIQQGGALETADDHISNMRLACTGFQPERGA